ncbi:hypothetical protein [Polyangium spumosum]|uniref:Outer membrane beta-barrel protein n=1 Tax=Polyangium spumosum TaxID=889282 RepID=A0A6N7PNB5_9BACT|nr:hypothetical protein [Polyangium spumosum]MRG91634.1 hypothetical protein [Polyangium spumosum]
MTRARVKKARGVGLAVLLVLAGSAARAWAAEDDEPDGVYGRLDGDLDLRLGAGAAFARGGPALAAHASLLYLSSAGLYVHYADALGADGPTITRSIAAGVLIEPLFLGRFATNLERGPARVDLGLDSFALGVGAFWEAPRGGALGAEPGFEFSIGIGLPFFARATGPVLGVRGALRVRPAGFSGAQPFNLLDQGALLSVTLGWRHIVPVHLVDAADRLAR